MTTIKITQLTDIGANLASTTVLPVVNMAGTPTTEKTVLGNIANVVLAGAGGNYVAAAKATTATTANTVLTAAQPNITSTGNLTGLTVSNATGVVNFSNTANITLGEVANLHISGGTNGQVLTTNGSNVLSWTTVSSGNSSYGNSNVAAYLPTYTGNIGVDTLVFADNTFQATAFVGTATTAEGLSNIGNATVVVDPLGVNNVWTFGTDGNLNTPGDIVGPANANLTIYANAGVHEFIFGDDGTFYAPDNVVLGGNSIYIGPGANTLNGIEHEVFIASSNLFPYVQAVVNNISDNGSADWVALGARGGDTGGQASLGFTSSGFGDANYTITGNGDGYVLVQSYAPGQTLLGGGGNLVLATGNQGSVKDIIFGTGGFLTANTFGRISHSNNSLELTRTGASLTFPDGSIQTTAYTSSNPFDQELNTTDNVTFANVTSTEAVKFSNSGNIVGALGYASNYVSIEAYGSNAVNITANDIYTWSFDNTGHFNTPANAGSFSTGRIQSANGYPSLLAYGSNGHGGPEFNWMNGDDLNDMSNVNVMRNTVYLNADGFYIGINENGVANTFTGSWTFGNTGLFTFPGTPRIDTSTNNFEVQAAEAINFEANTVVNIYTDSGNNAFQWQFGDDGILNLAGGNSTIQSIANNAGDSSGLSTLNLVPDSTTGDDRYIIVDPTGPNHIHIRAGGVQDGSNSLLFLGGEQAYTRIDDFNHEVQIGAYDSANTAGYYWSFDNTGTLTIPGNLVASGASPAPSLSGFSSLSAVDSMTVGSNAVMLSSSGNITVTGTVSADIFSTSDGGLTHSGTGLGINADAGKSVYLSADFGNINWNFGADGNLTLPGNTFAVNYSNGTQVSLGSSYGDSNVTTLLSSFGSNTITTTGNISVGNITGNTNGFAIGYLNIPQVAASNATLALGDAGKHYYSTTAGNFTLTVPNNTSAAFATGTAISIVVQAAGNILVNAASGVTLYMAGNSTAANRVVGGYGMATLMKVATDTWFINGTGVS